MSVQNVSMTQGERTRQVGGQASTRELGADVGRSARVMRLLVVVTAGAVAMGSLRHTLVSLGANIAIIGGILATPIISVVAWIGMLLPASMPLHHAAPNLMVGALVWLALAIIGAHMFRVDRASEAQ
jgi:hypothetical protein